MKAKRKPSPLPKNRPTGARWDVLAVLFASLTLMVCLIYAVIFAYPQVLPISLQAPVDTPVLTLPAVSATRATGGFPTFPAEWTAVFATRQAQLSAGTPPPPVSLSGATASPAVTLTATVGMPLAPSPTLTPAASAATLTALAATATVTQTATTVPTVPLETDTPEPATPWPTLDPGSYPGESSYPLPTGYP